MRVMGGIRLEDAPLIGSNGCDSIDKSQPLTRFRQPRTRDRSQAASGEGTPISTGDRPEAGRPSARGGARMGWLWSLARRGPAMAPSEGKKAPATAGGAGRTIAAAGRGAFPEHMSTQTRQGSAPAEGKGEPVSAAASERHHTPSSPAE